MLSTRAEIVTFALSFISHWQSYVTGGVLTGFITICERLSSHSLSKRAYFLIFVVSFSIAGFFMAWKEQYERAEVAATTLSQKQPVPPQINVPPAQVIVLPPPTKMETKGAPSATAGAKESSIDKPPQPRPTTFSLFKNEFPYTIKLYLDKWPVLQDNSLPQVQTQVYLDHAANSKFIGFYVPSSLGTYYICTHLPELIDAAFKLPQLPAVDMRDIGGVSTYTPDLTFSGRVLIYHEEFLSPRQVADLTDLYKSKGMALALLGPDYLMAQILGWSRANIAKAAH